MSIAHLTVISFYQRLARKSVVHGIHISSNTYRKKCRYIIAKAITYAKIKAGSLY